jgi:PAT family beta-lactamase induction signal transducer AmpG
MFTSREQTRITSSWRRIVTVGVEGFASGLPLMSVSTLLQGWLTANGIPVATIGLLGITELPYTLKLFWAPLMDHWAIPWPDRRRGWIAVLQLMIGVGLVSFARFGATVSTSEILAIGFAACVIAVLSASQDVVVDAYRTDLLTPPERGGGAASATLGYRGAMLFIGAGCFVIAGQFGWQAAFITAGTAMLVIVPITLAAPTLTAIQNPVPTLREAVLGPAREFITRTGRRRGLLILLLVMLYRWPDGLLGLMAVPFLIQSGFSPETIGTVQGGWGIGASIAGTAVGGLFFSKLGLNRALWVYGVVGAFSNLAYWGLARFGGGLKGLLVAVSVENFCSGMMVSAFLALLMSLCNPRFSAAQYALLSGVYALSRSVLSTPGGVIAGQVGWSTFFALTMAAAVPSLLLLCVLAPWKERLPRGAFELGRDAA